MMPEKLEFKQIIQYRMFVNEKSAILAILHTECASPDARANPHYRKGPSRWL